MGKKSQNIALLVNSVSESYSNLNNLSSMRNSKVSLSLQWQASAPETVDESFLHAPSLQNRSLGLSRTFDSLGKEV